MMPKSWWMVFGFLGILSIKALFRPNQFPNSICFSSFVAKKKEMPKLFGMGF
jgi:hypothetical protein